MINVEPIDNGTVIDHIEAGKGKRVLDILGINETYQHLVALVMNVNSKKMGKKDIVKIAGTFINETLTNKVALVSPNATINIIKNKTVEEKRKVSLPKNLKYVGKCPNPLCITNMKNVGDVKTEFKLDEKVNKYICKFCERRFEPSELI